MAEHAEALRRAITAPQIVVPEHESEHAYVRRADGITYVCPWQTKLRSLLAYGRMLSAGGAPLPGTVAAGDDDQAMAALARLEDAGARQLSARLHILASVWTIPLAWFVSFTATERWLSLGPGRTRRDRPSAAATASTTRAMVYTTPMSRARRRVARGLATLRSLPPSFSEDAWEPLRAEGDLADVGRWLEEFHPYSLVELDYGGLMHLLSDDALCGEQSVAEVAAPSTGRPRASASSRSPCSGACTAGGARSLNSSWRTEHRGRPANTRRTLFPNLPRCDDKYR